MRLKYLIDTLVTIQETEPDSDFIVCDMESNPVEEVVVEEFVVVIR